MIMARVHISTLRKMLSSPEPLDITCISVKGEVRVYKNVVGLSSHHYKGYRNIKFLNSGEIRKVRECLIVAVNGAEVFW